MQKQLYSPQVSSLRSLVSKNMKDIKNTTEKDLMKLVAEKREAVRNFRFNLSGSKTKNVKEGRTNRKEIARILTELNSRKKSA